jgi:hypothetical protein
VQERFIETNQVFAKKVGYFSNRVGQYKSSWKNHVNRIPRKDLNEYIFKKSPKGRINPARSMERLKDS